MESNEQRRVARQIIRAVTAKVAMEGYRLTKPTILTKTTEYTVLFFHFHKFRFGPHFRLHGAVRVLNDNFPAIGLTGWCVEHGGQFDPSAASIVHCVESLTSHLSSAGVRWHQEWSDPQHLAKAPPEVLTTSSREWLCRALAGDIVSEHYTLSRKLLGVV